MIKVAMFDTHSYDEQSFNKTNADFGFDIHYYKEHLSMKTVPLAKGADVSYPVIVGDSIWDVRGGHEAGIPVVGVGWGYATEDGLDDADAVCDSVNDLRALLVPAAR